MGVTILISLIFIVSLAQRNYSQDIHPNDSIVAIGENATFHCTYNGSGFLGWNLRATDGRTLPLLRIAAGMESIYQLGFNVTIELETVGSKKITRLVFEETEIYNGTEVQCGIKTGAAPPDFSNSPIATLRIFDRPCPPVGLNAILLENGSIILSWSDLSPSYVPVTYDVLVEDELIGGTDNRNSTAFLYTPLDGFCSVLNFSVQAFNRAGRSDRVTLIYYELIEPNIDIINASIHHNIRIFNDELRGDIEFETSESCEGFPVMYYLLLQEETGDGNVTILGPSTVPAFSISLQENSRYSYIVEATTGGINIEITRRVDKREFFTTDVQEASAVVSPTTHTVTVKCRFLPGSQSRGCHVQLMFVNKPTQTHNIERVGESECLEETITTSSDEVVSNILVFDWERDNSIGSLSIPVNSEDLQCLMTTTSDPVDMSEDGFPYLLPVVIAVPGGVIIVLVLLIVVTSCFIISCRKKGKEESHLDSNETTAKLNSYVRKDKDKWKGHTVTFSSNHLPEESYDQLSHPVLHLVGNDDQYNQLGPLVHHNGTTSNQNDNLYADIIDESTKEPIYNELGAAQESHHTALHSQLGTEREYAVLESGNSAPPPLPPPYASHSLQTSSQVQLQTPSS